MNAHLLPLTVGQETNLLGLLSLMTRELRRSDVHYTADSLVATVRFEGREYRVEIRENRGV